MVDFQSASGVVKRVPAGKSSESNDVHPSSFPNTITCTKKDYSETCVKRPLAKQQKIGLQDQLWLNAGQMYCRMLHREHSAIFSTFIKLPFILKIFVLLNLGGRFTQALLYIQCVFTSLHYNNQFGFTLSQDSDVIGNLPSLIGVFDVFSGDCNQTGRISRMSCVTTKNHVTIQQQQWWMFVTETLRF